MSEQLPIPCARCGAPMLEEPGVAILAPVAVRCGFCQATEELPREPAERVARLRARLAQIRWAQGAEEGPALALTRTLEWWRAHTLPMVFGMFLLVCAASAMSVAHVFDLPRALWPSALVSALAMPASAAAIFGGVTLGFLGSMRAFIRDVRPALEACAPAAPGAPMRCRACGGDLPPGGAGGFVRCGYCAADNLVTDAIAREREARLDRELHERRRRVAGTQLRLKDATDRYTRRLTLAMGLGVAVSLAITFGVGALASHAARMSR